jgi:hypothetical protein
MSDNIVRFVLSFRLLFHTERTEYTEIFYFLLSNYSQTPSVLSLFHLPPSLDGGYINPPSKDGGK